MFAEKVAIIHSARGSGGPTHELCGGRNIMERLSSHKHQPTRRVHMHTHTVKGAVLQHRSAGPRPLVLLATPVLQLYKWADTIFMHI